MIEGHGDDAFRYGNIRANFSTNIPTHADLSALQTHLASRLEAIRSYPEPSARSLERLIAEREGIDPECVLVTNGATDAIYLLAQVLCDLHTYTVCQPTFSEYADACRLYGWEVSDEGALCWLCNPNNPTGEVRDAAFVQQLLRRHEWVVIDHAYEDFTLAPLLTPAQTLAYNHLILLHSLTKRFGIPGLRVGYLTAPAPLVERLRRAMRPWTVNALAIEAARFLLTQPKSVFFGDGLPYGSLEAYLSEAQRLRNALESINGISVLPTSTNFMLATVATMTATRLKEILAQRHGLLIRDASNFVGLTPHHFRIAAQSPMDNDTLVEALKGLESRHSLDLRGRERGTGVKAEP